MKFHRSRYSCWQGYVLVIVLLVLATWFNDRAVDLPSYLCAAVAAALFLFLELRIREEQLVVGENGIVFQKGFFKKESKNVSFASIAEVQVVQSPFKKFLHYGDIVLQTSIGELRMRDADEVRMIEREIAYRRKR